MLSKRVVILAFIFLIAGLPLAYAAAPALPEETLPVTTRSAEARQVFDKGLARFQNDLRVETAVNTWKLAVKKDPNFALAHGFLAFVSRDPNEQAIHRQAAQGLSKKVTKGEQLFIAWMADSGDGHFLEAIADMNQLLGLYPHDQNLTWFAGWWLIHQNENEKAIPFFERTTNFPGSWNELAYCYAARHDWQKMLAAARKYMELAPKEPNPHDSLAELSRVMGRFEDAFSEYRDRFATGSNLFLGSAWHSGYLRIDGRSGSRPLGIREGDQNGSHGGAGGRLGAAVRGYLRARQRFRRRR